MENLRSARSPEFPGNERLVLRLVAFQFLKAFLDSL
jgi:hypothetical protein